VEHLLSRGEAGWAGGLGAHPTPGDVVGPYRIVGLLGTGGMATVYRCEDHTGAPVAVKVLNPARVLDEDVKRFDREYRTLSAMDHENVVRVYDTGVHEGYPWIAMELVGGTDLETEIESWRKDCPADRWTRVERILRGLCKGLGYVHDHGLVHRDLKPSNVLLTPDGHPKISDFGVVKSANVASTQLTMAGRLVGTVAFMAPELITDEEVDARADLYALGAVLYLMGTFRRPIEADSVAGYLARHLTDVPRPLTDLTPEAPPHLERIACRLLQKDRTWRHPNAAAVLHALERPDDSDRHPLRGRDPTLLRWTRALLQLQEGVGGSVAICAARGAGKTHLLQEFQDQARGQGVALAVASARMPEWLGHLAAQLGEDARDLGVQLGVDPTRPVVLAIDDLDRAHPDDVRALAEVIRHQVTLEARPLLTVFTAVEPQGELSALITGSSSGLQADVVSLDAIDLKSSVAMVRDRGVVGPAAPALGRHLHRLYGGVPGPMFQQLDVMIRQDWFEADGDQWRASRPLEDYKKAELPVPDATRERILARLQPLDPRSRELVDLMALLDRPAASGVVERFRPDDPHTPRRLDGLVDRRIVTREQSEQQEVLALADACTARVARAALSKADRQVLHGRLAKALLVRRRRANALEIAKHLSAAGDPEAAFPLYVKAARRTAREGRYSEVIEICNRADVAQVGAEGQLDVAEHMRLSRWLHLLRGEALLARRAWSAAVPPLQDAVAAARAEGDEDAIARCLGSLGRAHYRLGAFDTAAPLLRDALARSQPRAPARASATRALADIEMRAGNLVVAATLWREALLTAVQMGSRDAEARAHRGLAHLCAMEGRLSESCDMLAQADDLLNPDGDYRVRAGVLARAVELDLVGGRLGSALYRAELLVELAKQHGMGDRMPEAYALLAEIQSALGDAPHALEAAQQSLVFTRAAPDTPWSPQVRLARALVQLGRPAEAEAALPQLDTLPASTVDDPAAQVTALRARIAAARDPGQARELAAWTLRRPAPSLSLAGARISLDGSHALMAAGQAEAARQAAKRGLKALQGGSGDDGLRLELLLAMQVAAPDARIASAIREVVDRMVPLLPPHAAPRFRSRPTLRDCLD